MNRSFLECAKEVAKCAGEILREQVLDRLLAFRKRRRDAVLALGTTIPSWLSTAISRRVPREPAKPAPGGPDGD